LGETAPAPFNGELSRVLQIARNPRSRGYFAERASRRRHPDGRAEWNSEASCRPAPLGGTFIKTASTFYQRTYFSHLAPRAAESGLLPVPDAKGIIYKDFTGFFSPFDVRGAHT
jgi:hypothetical protein